MRGGEGRTRDQGPAAGRRRARHIRARRQQGPGGQRWRAADGQHARVAGRKAVAPAAQRRHHRHAARHRLIQQQAEQAIVGPGEAQVDDLRAMLNGGLQRLGQAEAGAQRVSTRALPASSQAQQPRLRCDAGDA